MTTAVSSDHSWSRRCSTETVFSIQGKETDYVRDTSDTDAVVSDPSDVEYEPVTEPEDDDAPVEDTSEQSDNEIISTKVIEVSVDDGELQFADSEETDSYDSDSEIDLYDFWLCTQCRTRNNNPLYSYCQKCYKVRKNFFPPRPKPKNKKKTKLDEIPRTFSQDSGVHSSASQELLDFGEGTSTNTGINTDINTYTSTRYKRKRTTETLDIKSKRSRLSRTDSDSEFSDRVTPLTKTKSDPEIVIEPVKITKKVIANSLIESVSGSDRGDSLCVICVSEPKSGVFVHGRIAHICCCYKCAVKVWAKAKRCPVCNCRVSNVLKAVVM